MSAGVGALGSEIGNCSINNKGLRCDVTSYLTHSSGGLGRGIDCGGGGTLFPSSFHFTPPQSPPPHQQIIVYKLPDTRDAMSQLVPLPTNTFPRFFYGRIKFNVKELILIWHNSSTFLDSVIWHKYSHSKKRLVCRC